MTTLTTQIRTAGGAIVLSFAAACGGNVEVIPHGSPGSGGSATASSGVTSGGPATGGGSFITSGASGGASHVTVGTGGGMSAVTTSGMGGNPCYPDSCNGPSSSTGGLISCGGISGVVCPANYFCDFPVDDCGADDDTGVCMPIPSACGKTFDPLCACDGKTYGNSCLAQQASQDASALRPCPAPSGTFACGAHFCVHGVEYCVRTVADTPGSDTFSCIPLPAACSAASVGCGCLAAGPCNNNACSQSADGDFTVLCPGG